MREGKRSARAVGCTVLLLLCLACGGGGSGAPSGPIPYLGLPFPITPVGSATPFSFVVLSDTHVRLPGYPDDGFFDNQGNLDALAATIDMVNARRPGADFVAVTGDLVGTLFSDDEADYGVGTGLPAEVFQTMMSVLAMPFHVTLGNHDYQKGYDPQSFEGIPTDDIERVAAVWQKVLGVAPYRSWVHEGIRFVFLDSNRGPAGTRKCFLRNVETFCTGSFDQPQLDWLEAQLQLPEPCLLFFHHPPVTDTVPDRLIDFPGFHLDAADGFYALASTHRAKIAAIFVGHGHLWAHDVLHGSIPVFETDAVADPGGAAGNGHVVDVNPATNTFVVTRLDP